MSIVKPCRELADGYLKRLARIIQIIHARSLAVTRQCVPTLKPNLGVVSIPTGAVTSSKSCRKPTTGGARGVYWYRYRSCSQSGL